ncbi:hypothetical protein N7474_010143 [Penicillium riverlandense]|uniref:uncharacterized protein n=1 Tax=Penicillium riverlandense TaxID=1903569 RepID=UPI002546B575|nr:uncharacterized protein N7474_010143 [Penicillium riverlandense]KAJ5808874.1 hypothetical protein N7474_010143 [Penicillium riverlandense]
MLPSISKDAAYGIQVNLTSGSFYWCDSYELGVQEKELLRLEAKFVQHSLELAEGAQLDQIYQYVKEKAQAIKTSGPSLLEAPQVKTNLEALESDPKFLHLLRNGFPEPIRAGKIWGDSKYKEMVTFTKLRFGPAYALLIICIFGTGGRDDTFDQEIHACANDGQVKGLTLEDGTQCYALKKELESRLRCFYSRQLWVALFAFAAYIYPRDDTLDQS